MLYLIGLPILLLIFPTTVRGILLYLLMYLVICFVTKGYMKREKINISYKIIKPQVVIPIAAVLGYYFYVRWEPSGAVSSIAELVHIPKGVFLCAVSVVLAVLSIFSQNVFLAPVQRALEVKNRERNLSRVAAINNAPKKMGIGALIFCAVLALTVAFVSFITCPLYSEQMQSYDQPIFIYIGKMMLNGKVPYRDLFDHKGIILYFIQWLGLLISVPGTYSGIWFLEIINLFAFNCILYKIASLFSSKKSVLCLTTLFVSVIYGIKLYEAGNFTEEYALPWISLSYYVFIKYFLSGSYKKSGVFFTGLGCGIVAFLRVNMAAIWIAYVPLIIISLLIKKRGKEIISCILCFTAGIATVFTPVIIYSLVTGCLDEMVRYYILFNFAYSSSKGSFANQLAAASELLGILLLVVCAFIFSVGFRSDNSRQMNKIHLINFWGLSVSLAFAVMSGRKYPHYAMILLPFLAAPIINILELFVVFVKDIIFDEGRKTYGRIYKTAVFALCVILVIMCLPESPYSFKMQDAVTKYLVNNTEPDDDVLIIGTAAYYLKSGRSTENKFFYQTPPVDVSDELYGEFLDEFNEKRSDVVLVASVDLEDSGNLGKFLNMLEQETVDGVYERKDFDKFYVYNLIE